MSLEGCLSASLALNAAACAAAGLVASASGGAGARAAVTRELTRRSRTAAMRTAFEAVVRGAFARVGAGPEGVTGEQNSNTACHRVFSNSNDTVTVLMHPK